jgi:hypothetical protein
LSISPKNPSFRRKPESSYIAKSLDTGLRGCDEPNGLFGFIQGGLAFKHTKACKNFVKPFSLLHGKSLATQLKQQLRLLIPLAGNEPNEVD